jgi:DnaJ-class molecular chaperone
MLKNSTTIIKNNKQKVICKYCSASGWHVEYAEFKFGGVLIPCKHCNGKGWVIIEKND